MSLCASAHKALSNAAMRGLSKLNGGVAQLGEHLLCKQGVIGSIPFTSTRLGGEVRREVWSASALLFTLYE